MSYFKRLVFCLIMLILIGSRSSAEQHMYLAQTDTLDEMELCNGELSHIAYYDVDDEHPLYTSVDGVLYSKDKKCLLSYPAAMTQNRYEIETTTERIGNYAFAYSSLEYIDLFSSESSTLKKIGEGAFFACHNLKQICISDSIQEIGKKAFLDTSDELLVVADQNADVCVEIPESASTLILEDLYDYREWVDHNDEIWTYCDLVGNERFQIMNECLFRGGSLIAYPGLKQDSVFAIPEGTTRVDASILQNDYISELIIPSSCEWIQTVQQDESNFARYVVDPLNSTYSSRNGVLFDKNCTVLISYPRKRLGDIYAIPDTVLCVGYDSFAYSSDIKEIICPSSLKTIESFAFYDSSVQRINLPESISGIEFEAFEYCPYLKEIVISKGSYAEELLTSNTEYIDLSGKLVYVK